jgi:RNA polymerase sigma-70 factor (ECF subfamily)
MERASTIFGVSEGHLGLFVLITIIQACSTGDLQGLLHVLAEDVVMHSDGGGKVPAALKPIYGAARVARGLLGLMRKIPPGVTSQLALVNGQLGILTYLDGAPYAVLAFSLASGRIQEIALNVNPDKLRGIPPLV